MSDLALRLIQEAKDKHLTKLDLGMCGLTTLPDELFELRWLEELILSKQYWEINTNGDWQYINTANEGEENTISAFPGSLTSLVQLRKLVAGEPENKWSITNITALSRLSNLTQLDLTNTDIADISPLATLSNLTHITLISNQIIDISPLESLANLTHLSLNHNYIIDVSPLESLANLTHLSLNHNYIIDVSPLETLSSLTHLNLGNTQVSNIRPLMGLSNLTQLILDSARVTDFSPLAGMSNLTSLNLSNTKFVDLILLKGLLNLTQLDLSDNQTFEINPLSTLENLRNLNLKHCDITNFSPLTSLSNLTHLNLAGTGITDVSPLAGLSNLTLLDLALNRITHITPLLELTKLTDLYLGATQIGDVNQLSTFENLRVLSLEHTGITDVSSLSALSNLTHLYLSFNKFVDVSPLSVLSNLTELTLDQTGITDISPLSELPGLTLLDLSFNRIVDINPLANLSNLTQLNLSFNGFTDVSPLSRLSNLTLLDLSNNQIVNVSSLKALYNLTQFNLNNNQITDIRPLAKLIENVLPTLKNNPLVYPPVTVAEKGIEAILIYFRNLNEQGEQKLNEAKLIIVGEPGAGKTSLMKRLLDPSYQIPQKEDHTIGIQVREGWEFPQPDDNRIIFSANIWDFGGQQIQYMTHQFFLTPGAVYVLVSANDRKETIANFPYWFNIIHLLGEENNHYSPILVVLNNINEQFIQQFDEQFYIQRYPELQISNRTVDLSLNDTNFLALREEIQKMLTNLPLVNDARPAHWSEISTALREKSKTQNHINFSEFAEICCKYHVKDEDSQLLLSYYLHRMGSLLHFADDPTLRDFIILNPQWAVDAVYSVLDNTSIAKADGYFGLDKLDDIWRGKYDTIEQSKLLNLMKRDNFEICYELDNSKDSFLAPQLLNDCRPFYEWSNTNTLKFRFQYKFMPEGIITRLIVRLNDYIANEQGIDLVWRKGMVLEKKGCHAQILEDETRKGLKVIDIAVNGELNERKYLLRTIRDAVEKLHKKWFRNIQAEQMIPCNCEVCTETEETTYFAFDELKQYLKEREGNIKCRNGHIKDVNVQLLLEGVFDQYELSRQDSKREEKLWSDEGNERLPARTPGINIHNHMHPVITTQLEKTMDNQLVKPTEPEKWYKGWLFISLCTGGFTGIIVGLLFQSFGFGLITCLASSFIICFFNPKRRYYRAAWVLLSFAGAIPIAPFLTLPLKGLKAITDGNIDLEFNIIDPMNPWLAAFIFLISILAAVYLFNLDDKQK